ncbi:MAG: GxxExxY protein [Bacteroidetes bacterium]|nr:GxxExxY protein [Bacteroidota bacterium]MDA1121453.1 GxxExxY protein [Bacteroidota bacterium]
MGLKDYTDDILEKELKYKDITEKIIGASFEVHKFLGNACLTARQGFQEVIYQRALAWEMAQAGLAFEREIDQDIYYKQFIDPIGTRRADFVVEGKVLVELKAIIQLEDVHLAQALNYLKAYKLEVGLLINFGSKSLTFKRLVN